MAFRLATRMAGDELAQRLSAGEEATRRRFEQSGPTQYLAGSQGVTPGLAMDKVAGKSEFKAAVDENAQYFYDEFIPRMARFENAKNRGWDLSGENPVNPQGAA